MTYVMSDAHGRYDLFTGMLDQIRFCRDDTLYLLGDAIDRNPGGIRILKEIMDRSNIHMLLGNHEHMMLHAIERPDARSLSGKRTNRELWYRNGGQITEKEFRKEPEETQTRILRFLKNLPLNMDAEVNGTRFLFCHASPACMFRVYGFLFPNETEFAVWNRIESWLPLRFPADVLICGHTPTAFYQDIRPMEICKLRDHVYDIDCGCAAGEKNGGRLACMRLEDLEAFYTSL